MSTNRRPASALFTLAAILAAVAALHFARAILLPFALATFLSFLLAPLAERLERWRLGRIPSVIAVVSVAFAVLGLLGWVVTSQLVDLSDNMDKYRDNIVAKVRAVAHGSETFSSVAKTIEDVQKELTGDDQQPADKDARQSGDSAPANESRDPVVAVAPNSAALPGQETKLPSARETGGSPSTDGQAVAVKVVSLPPSPLAQVQAWLGPLVAPLTTAGMVVVLVLFMLLQREDQRNRLIRLFGASNIHATTEALTDIVNRVSRYLRMQFLINAGYGLCVGAGMALIGVPNAVMFGVLSFSLRFLPYIGPWISAVLPVAVSLAISDGWTQPLLVVGWFVVLELIVNNVAEPLLYGSSIGVSGMGVIVAAIFWTWLWGTIGLVLAMPLTVCLVVMSRYIPALRFINVLLGDQPTLTSEERIYQRMLAFDGDEVRELATKYLADATPTELYDNVLIPALRLAEEDRHAGVLTDEQDESVQEVARELIAELHAQAPIDELEGPSKARVLCLPLRDESDKTAALMLGKLLEGEGVETIIGSVDALTGERVEAVESAAVDLVVVSILPPLPQRDSRLLCRKLRERLPDLPILVGFWDAAAGEESRRLLAAKGDGEIVTTLAEAAQRIKAVASRTATAPLQAAALSATAREAG